MPTSGETNIQGSNGTWTFHIDKNPGNRRDNVTITFVPKPKVNCSDIRIIQSVSITAMDKYGVPIKGMPENLIFKRGMNPFANRNGYRIRDGDGNQWSLDCMSCEADPYYNGDDALHDIGEHGPDRSTIRDSPGSDFTDVNVGIDSLEMNFETCAICAETGECLGCIKWRATAHRGGKQGEPELIDPLAPDPCSQTVKKATKAFVRTHSKVDGAGTLRWFCPDDNTFGPEIPRKAYNKFMEVMIALRQVSLGPHREDSRIASGMFIIEAEPILRAVRENPTGAAVKFTWSGTQSRTIPSLLFSSSYDLTAEDLLPFEQNDPRLGNDFVAMRNLVVDGGVMQICFEALLRKQGLSTIREDDPISLLFAVGLKTEKPVALAASASREDVSRFVARMMEESNLDEDLLKGLSYLNLNMGHREAEPA
jgi:hypothetical protein